MRAADCHWSHHCAEGRAAFPLAVTLDVLPVPLGEVSCPPRVIHTALIPKPRFGDTEQFRHGGVFSFFSPVPFTATCSSVVCASAVPRMKMSWYVRALALVGVTFCRIGTFLAKLSLPVFHKTRGLHGVFP